jgi:hypothetical protein
MPELTALLCKGCGAPLPESDDLQLQMTCRFCGVVNERARTGAPLAPADVRVHPATAAGGGAAIAGIVVAFVLALVGSAAWVIDSALSTTRTVSTAATTDAAEASARAARAAAARAGAPLAPAELASLDGTGGWRSVTVAAPPGDWARVDPVAAMAWMDDVARAWDADARLHRVDVKKVAEDGTIDLTSEDAELGFRYVSPSRIAAWTAAADRQGNVEGVYGLMVSVKGRDARALVQRGRPDRADVPPAAATSLPMADLLARARRNKAWVPKPFYQGYLIRLRDEGWVWYLHSLSGRDSLPRVRAKDGRVWPYR